MHYLLHLLFIFIVIIDTLTRYMLRHAYSKKHAFSLAQLTVLHGLIVNIAKIKELSLCGCISILRPVSSPTEFSIGLNSRGQCCSSNINIPLLKVALLTALLAVCTPSTVHKRELRDCCPSQHYGL